MAFTMFERAVLYRIYIPLTGIISLRQKKGSIEASPAKIDTPINLPVQAWAVSRNPVKSRDANGNRHVPAFGTYSTLETG